MNASWIKRAELILGILLSATVLFLLVVRATHVGPLWRDECDSIQTARLPTFGDVTKNFQYDSFPLPFLATIRAYTTLFGESDASLRLFGLLVGVALICAGWFNSRSVSADTPLVFLTLAGLNTTFLIWGTTVRGYGLGSVLIVFGFGMAAKFLTRLAARWLWLIFLLFLCAVQCLVNNTVLVFAISLAAIGVCAVRRRLKAALAVSGILAAVAASYFPYLKTYSEMGWHVVLQSRVTFTSLWQTLREACGEPAAVMPLLWGIIFLLSMSGGCWRLWATRREKPSPEWDLLCFGLLGVFFSLAGYYLFLRLLSYPPHPWYFLAIVCLLASAIDLIIANLCQFRWVRLGRLLFTAAALVAIPFAVWPEITKRQTNIDIVAQSLEREIGANDLIVLNPWFLGVAFNRYYHGPAPWLTIPVIADHRVHRFDLLQTKMMSDDDALQDLKDAMAKTLQGGNRVYLVGGAGWLRAGKRAAVLAPAPYSEFGWSYLPYSIAWSQQVAEFLQVHVLHGANTLGPNEHVNEVENVSVWKVDGWRD